MHSNLKLQAKNHLNFKYNLCNKCNTTIKIAPYINRPYKTKSFGGEFRIIPIPKSNTVTAIFSSTIQVKILFILLIVVGLVFILFYFVQGLV